MSHELPPEVQKILNELDNVVIARCPAPALLGHRPECKGDCDREITFREMMNA